MRSHTLTLASTYFFDYHHPDIQKIVRQIKIKNLGILDRAIHIYNIVRDGWAYNPYNLRIHKECLRASYIVQLSSGHCIDKSVLMIALARACNIPARLHLAKVTNHIAAEKLIEKMGTHELTPHGFVGLFLNDRWVKATPSFNKELCYKIGVDPLDFDGIHDSVFQEFDKEGGLFMKYLDDYGSFSDLPYEFIRQNITEHYPSIIDQELI